MKGLFKLLVLALLLVPVWITFLTFTGKDKVKSAGALVVVENALQASESDLRVSNVLHMAPSEQVDRWKLVGLATPSDRAGNVGERRFVAKLRKGCPRFSEAACWVVEEFDFPATLESAVRPATSPADPEGDGEAQRLLIAQRQLKELGFELGPVDGRMGPLTEKAVSDYVVLTKVEVTEDWMEQALLGLEVMARLDQGSQYHAKGDIWDAVNEYSKVSRLDPDNVDVRFKRAVIYHEMGLTDLAISEYDRALEVDLQHVMAYHGRGNAQFSKGEYWLAFADHANAFGFRTLGDRYLVVREQVRDATDRVAPELEALAEWAKGTWDQAKDVIAEKLEAFNDRTPGDVAEDDVT